MSYYYTFFLGMKYADGTIDYVGEEPIIIESYSRGFFEESFLEPFDYVCEKEMSDRLKTLRKISGWDGNEYIAETRYLSFKDFYNLSREYIKSGYYLAEDVNRYLKQENKYDFDGFYEKVDPIIYSSLVRTRPETIIRESIEFEGEKEVLHGANDYMWFAYPDYDSNKYKAAQIVSIIRFIEKNCELGKGEELLILEKYD